MVEVLEVTFFAGGVAGDLVVSGFDSSLVTGAAPLSSIAGRGGSGFGFTSVGATRFDAGNVMEGTGAGGEVRG